MPQLRARPRCGEQRHRCDREGASLVWKWGEHMVESNITRPTLIDLDDWLRRDVSAGRLALNVTIRQPPKVEGNSPEGRLSRVCHNVSTIDAGDGCKAGEDGGN